MSNFQQEKVDIVPLDYAYGETFFDKYTLNLPVGVSYDKRQHRAEPEKTYYIDRGVTTVACDPNHAASDMQNVPPSRMNTFIHPGTIQQGLQPRGKVWANATEADAIATADFWWNRNGGRRIVFGGHNELGGSGQDYTALYPNNPGAYLAFERRMGDLCMSIDGFNFGPYDGIGMGTGAETDADRKAALQSNAAAHAFLSQYSNGFHPYFNNNMYEKQALLLNYYYRSWLNPWNKTLFGMAIAEMAQMALDHVGSNMPIMIYVQTGFSEFVNGQGGYTEVFKRMVNDDTYSECWTAPDYPGYINVNEAWIAASIPKRGRISNFHSGEIYGSNPNILQPNYINPDNGNFPERVTRDRATGNIVFGRIPTGTTQPTFGRVQNSPFDPVTYNPNLVYGYPMFPVGQTDYHPASLLTYQEVIQHTGGDRSYRYAKSRTPGTGEPWTSEGKPSIIDRMQDNKPLVQVGMASNGSGKGWVKIIADRFQGASREVEVDLGNGKMDIYKYWGASHNLYKINVNVNG